MSTAAPDGDVRARVEDLRGRAEELRGRVQEFFSRRPRVGAKAAANTVAQDLQELVRAEIALARAELEPAMRAKAVGSALFVVAAVSGWLGLQGLLITLGFVLAIWLPGWAAALIVTALLLLVTAVAALVGRRQISRPVSLDTTKRNVEEDIAWARQHLRRG